MDTIIYAKTSDKKRLLEEKIKFEFTEFKNNILKYPKIMIFDFAYEIILKEDIGKLLLFIDFSEKEYDFLLSSKDLINYLYNLTSEKGIYCATDIVSEIKAFAKEKIIYISNYL